MDLNWFEKLERRIPKGGVRTRFAPSPTGYMHVGNLRTALYTWLIARTDQGRLVEGATEVIYNTLRKCGLTWDEGPDIGGPVGPYVQTERRGLYANFARLLVEKGHAYYCFCGKSESEEDSGEFDRADDPCRALSPEEAQARVDAGEPYVIRQKIPHGGQTTFSDAVFGDITVDNDTLDDQVLLKSDGLPTYNFANVIDDHLMGITHVVRGSEYLSSAPKYNLLYQAFGWDVPTYIHCSPVMRDQHNKMSKRKGDPSYEDLLAMGYLSEAVVNYVTLLGWSPRGEYAEREFFTLAELSEIFDIGGISKSPAIFDMRSSPTSRRSWTSSTPCPSTGWICSPTRSPRPTRRCPRRCWRPPSPPWRAWRTGRRTLSTTPSSAWPSPWRSRTPPSCGPCASPRRARRSPPAARWRSATSWAARSACAA